MTTVRVEREEGILVVGGFASVLLTPLDEGRVDGDDDDVVEVAETMLGFEVVDVTSVVSVSSALGALEV